MKVYRNGCKYLFIQRQSSSVSKKGPLNGLKILDLSRILAGLSSNTYMFFLKFLAPYYISSLPFFPLSLSFSLPLIHSFSVPPLLPHLFRSLSFSLSLFLSLPFSLSSSLPLPHNNSLIFALPLTFLYFLPALLSF